VQAVEERQGQMIGCPEEIAYRMHYITAAELERLGTSMKGSAYGQYLLRVLADEA
jgi:glucose-1-phosphate thymidylyltransferase